MPCLSPAAIAALHVHSSAGMNSVRAALQMRLPTLQEHGLVARISVLLGGAHHVMLPERCGELPFQPSTGPAPAGSDEAPLAAPAAAAQRRTLQLSIGMPTINASHETMTARRTAAEAILVAVQAALQTGSGPQLHGTGGAAGGGGGNTAASAFVPAVLVVPNTASGAQRALQCAKAALAECKGCPNGSAAELELGTGSAGESAVEAGGAWSAVQDTAIAHVEYSESYIPAAGGSCLAWLVAAADAGSREAQFALARCLTSRADKRGGPGTKITSGEETTVSELETTALRACTAPWRSGGDDTAAVQYCRSAAAAGLVPAMTLLGDMLSHGCGCAADASAAREWLQHAVDAGDPVAMCVMGEMVAGSGGDGAAAVAWYKQAAEGGSAQGMMRLGDALLGGVGCVQDKVAGFKAMQQAAEAGNARAMVKLSGLYLRGTGCDVDGAALVEWLKRAAATGDIDAMRRAGNALANSADPDDQKLGFRLCQRAAATGNSWAAETLGKCFLNGLGCQKSASKGRQWFRRAAMAGHSRSMARLAKLLGRVNSSAARTEGMQWLARGAAVEEAGGGGSHQDCMMMLAELHRREGHRAEATQVYLKAAKLGNVAAMEAVSKAMVAAGRAEEGFQWCKRATHLQDFSSCTIALGRMYEGGVGCDRDLRQAAECYRKIAQRDTTTSNRRRDAQAALDRVQAKLAAESATPASSPGVHTSTARRTRSSRGAGRQARPPSKADEASSWR